MLDSVFLACQDTRFILCVFKFFEGEAWVGHKFKPLCRCVLYYWMGWVGFKGEDTQAILGQKHCLE